MELKLAGRRMSPQLKKLKMNNVNVLGEVDDAYAFMLSSGIMLVPLLSGGGMRVKIIEGMALGKTVIATAVGAKGIAYENNKNIIIANTAEEFISAIERCLTNKKFSDTIGRKARELVEVSYNNQKICKGLKAFYQSVVSK